MTQTLIREVHTVPETSAITKLSRATIFRLLARGELDGVLVGGRRLVYADSIAQLLDPVND